MSNNHEATGVSVSPSKGMAASVSVAAASFPLQALKLTFDTTNDDKDHDTVVSTSIDNLAEVMGSGNVGVAQHWNDGSRNIAGVPVVNAVDFFSAGQGHLNITIHPNGDDEWHFNLMLEMEFAAGGRRTVNWAGVNLAEDRPSVVLTWR